ncbi:hypothetical protein [Intestinibacter bartlettii]|uniref:hypothetical protein n=1 Tax=Intestinibacter bartlettii TaxID=261299 RepID=UPI00321A96AD
MIIRIANLNLELNGQEKWFQNKYIKKFKYNIRSENIDWGFNFYEVSCDFQSDNIIRNYENRQIYRVNNSDYQKIRLSPSDKESFYICNIDNIKKSDIYFNEVASYLLPTKLLDLLSFEHVILQNNGVILHSSFIKYNDYAILFSGPSGVGKSTQANLWIKFKDAEIINGDRSILRYIDNEWQVFGSPYCGSSEIFKNDQAKLKVIVVLEQAKENKIEEMSVIEKYKFILSQIAVNTWNEEDMKKVTTLIENIINSVLIIKLKCLPNESAVDILHKYLEGDVINDGNGKS